MAERMVSYAQNAEDVVLNRAFLGQEQGFWVDVGASHPTRDSVTRHFSDLGWSGVNVEPLLADFELLQRQRTRDANLRVGVGATPGTLDFHVVPDAPAMSTFSAEQVTWIEKAGFRTEVTQVPVVTLDALLAEHAAGRTIDFLKVDVEGFEGEVLGGVDWTRWRPRALVVETRPPIDPWEERLLAAGFERTQWDGINKFFVRDEELPWVKSMLRTPAVPAVDLYDPWYYVEQLHERDQAIALSEPYFLAAAGADAAAAPALRALGQVLMTRADLLAAFGAPPATRLRELLGWAAVASDRPDEPASAALVEHAAVYRRLAERS